MHYSWPHLLALALLSSDIVVFTAAGLLRSARRDIAGPSSPAASRRDGEKVASVAHRTKAPQKRIARMVLSKAQRTRPVRASKVPT